ncbi:MAG: NAD-dependent epimerase/dehydratase family protein [Lewinellaceae bacterium]|nr:NAD-dependent epimerase/dehydratase family protein [Saprospiraceae bacterium]MCB9338008.1 NAD-dependent epimerase/dehydratase family protein [Lewinellaceae bacterium]
MEGNITLVTGGTGFLGAYLIRLLVLKGYQNIRALKRPGSPMELLRDEAPGVEWLEGDLLDLPSLEQAFQGVTTIYHCAGMVSFASKDARQMMRTNQEGTANIVNIALEEGVKKLVFVSSIAAIGRTKEQSYIDEKTKWKGDAWNTPYGISKHLAEMEVWRGIAEGLNAAIVNPSNVLGSGFWEGRTGTGQFFSKIWKGLPFYPKGGSGFVDVRDVARFMILLMESDLQGERFILNGENLSFKKVLYDIAQTLQVKAPGTEVSPFIREVAWRATWLLSKLTGKPPFITKQTARASARTFIYDNQKSLRAFPSFTYTPIQRTIEETGRQFLENAQKGFQPAMLPFTSFT